MLATTDQLGLRFSYVWKEFLGHKVERADLPVTMKRRDGVDRPRTPVYLPVVVDGPTSEVKPGMTEAVVASLSLLHPTD